MKQGNHTAQWLPLAFAALIAMHLALVLVLPTFVTADGPTHMGGAVAFWDAVLHGDSVVHQYATIQLLPATNLIPDLPAGLLAMAVSPGSSRSSSSAAS